MTGADEAVSNRHPRRGKLLFDVAYLPSKAMEDDAEAGENDRVGRDQLLSQRKFLRT